MNSTADSLRLRPTRHVRALAVLAILVFSLFLNDPDSNDQLVLPLMVFPVAIRVAFFMGIRADPTGIVIRRLTSTARIDRTDVTTVLYRPPTSTSITERRLGDTASLTVFGKELEPFRLTLYETNATTSAHFAYEANRMLETSNPIETDELFDLALKYDESREWSKSTTIQLASMPGLATALGSAFAYRGLTGDYGNNPWLENAWAVPACVLAACLGLVALRAIYRSVRRNGSWEPYAVLLRPRLQELGEPADTQPTPLL